MGGTSTISLIMLFGYISMALILAAFMRSKLKFLQKLFLPNSILAGFFLLLLGPIFNIISMPTDLDWFIYIIITPALFVVLGLRGFTTGKGGGREIASFTAFLTKGLVFQGIIGILFTLLLIVLFLPELSPGFGSLMMLGYGHDPVLARYFGGFYEQYLAFEGGSEVGFSFGILGFLFSYLLGLFMIVRARKNTAPDYPGENIESEELTGFLERDNKKPSAGKLTTHIGSMDSFTFHLAVAGLVFLVSFGFVRLVGYLIINSFSGLEIIGEVFLFLHYIFGYLAGVLAYKLICRWKIEYLLDKNSLARISGVLIDYLIAGAIATLPLEIPLMVSVILRWEVIVLAVISAILTMFLVQRLSRHMFGENDLPKKAVLFGFLTGNITSAVALLRVVDPNMEDPVAARLAIAGGLFTISGLPLLFVIILPLINADIVYMLYAILAMVFYGVLWYLVWRFIINREITEKSDAVR